MEHSSEYVKNAISVLDNEFILEQLECILKALCTNAVELQEALNVLVEQRKELKEIGRAL